MAQKGNSLRKTVLLLFALVLVSSCRPISIWFASPDGPPEYKLGWEDGCDTGLSAQGTYIYRAIYGFKKRPEMADNDQYKAGWNEGYSYCRFAMASEQ
jgi:hypothetical protein